MSIINQLNLSKVSFDPNIQYILSPLVQEYPLDGNIRRLKDLTLFFVALALVICVFVYCGVMLNQNPDDKWAMTIASSIISALLGFLTGRKIH